MAERAHEVPAKYGEVHELFHPRMRSYGRRIEASIPGTIVLVAALAFIFYKRPALPYTILVLLIGTIAGINLYSVLKPTIIVITKTHVLRARTFGWFAVPRADISHTIFAEKLYPKKAYGQNLKTMAGRIRYRSFPAMWAVDKDGKQLMRLDGRVWDGKTMREVSSKLSAQTTIYKQINVISMDKEHKGLITFNELHPGWRSSLLTIFAVIFVVILFAASFLPEEIARNIYMIH